MSRSLVPRVVASLFVCTALPATPALAEGAATFDASPLVAVGDTVRYGSYTVKKIGEGIYQLDDRSPERTTGGVDMYLIRGETRALMVDLGNNYIVGYAPDKRTPRANAAEEFRAVVYGLVGKLPLAAAITHMHPDHDGMTGALLNRNVPLWASAGEDLTALQKQYGIDPSVLSVFTCGAEVLRPRRRTRRGYLPDPRAFGGAAVYVLKKDRCSSPVTLSDQASAWRLVGEGVRKMAEDTQKLVDYIAANFSPMSGMRCRSTPATPGRTDTVVPTRSATLRSTWATWIGASSRTCARV